MEDQKTKEKRTPRLDRIVLDATTLAVVAKVQSQIEAVFNGLVKLTNKDVVNYLVQCRTSELSGQELDVLRQTHFDEVKAAKWAVERLQAARSNMLQSGIAAWESSS